MSDLIYENTWQENKEAFKTKKVAVIPVGSNEQHGPALPVGTDWMIADHLAKEVAKKTDKALVTAAIPFGYAMYHNDFEGTLAVPKEVLKQYVLVLCEQLIKYGATHILFLNGHGGNNAPLYDVGQCLRHQGVPVANIQWFETAGAFNKDWGLIGHGDIVETSMMLHIAPETVKLDRAHIPTNKTIGGIKLLDLHRGEFDGASVYLNLRTSDVSDSGDLIEFGHSEGVDYSRSAKDATAELGEKVCHAVVDYVVKFIDQFVKFKY